MTARTDGASRRWTGAAQHLVPALKLVWKSNPRLMVVSAFVVALQAVMPLVPLYLVRNIVNSIADGAELRSVLLLVALAGVATIVTMWLRSIALYLREVQSMGLSDYVQTMIHKKSLELDLEYYEGPEFFDKLYRAQEEAPYRPAVVVDNLMTLFRTVASLVGIVVLLAVVLPWYAMPALAVASIPLAIARSVASRRGFRWRMRATASNRHVQYLNWLLTGRAHAKELRLFALSPLLAERSSEKRGQLRRDRIVLSAQRSVGEGIAYGAQTAVVFVIVAVVAVQALRGAATLGDLVMFLQAVQRAQTFLGEFLGGANSLYESNLFLGTVFEFLGLGPTVPDPPAGRPVPEVVQTGLEVRDLGFTYPGTDRRVLDGVSLSVGPGEIVALVGDNGAGKTTLMKLICRFYDPQDGALTVDGVDLRAINKSEWWSHVTALFQDYAQYHYTAWENVWFGRSSEDPDRDRISRSAEYASADDFIRKLKDGYDSMLGRFLEEGAELSGGQWQKLALARTFYRDTPFAILDEPTSGLDPESEALLLKRLRRWAADKSVLLVTHRIAAARIADRIYVMRGGKITEHGSHDELCRIDGTYARMYRMQLDQIQGIMDV